MGYVLHKHCIKFPSSLLNRCVPETWLFEIDHPDYMDEALNDVFEMVADLKKNLGRKTRSTPRNASVPPPSSILPLLLFFLLVCKLS
jgi:hypothetical protein